MEESTRILRKTEGGTLIFHCPGCKENHEVWIEGPTRWTWNKDMERPTFAPSIKVSWPANPDATEEFKQWRTERICHSFITDGQIQFLEDCTHELKGQTVPLPRW